MIEALAQVVCTVIQVEAGAHGPSTVFQVRLPSGEATSLNALDVRVNAIGFSARQNLVYGVDHHGRLVALDRTGRVVGKPTRPVPVLRNATAGVVVGERLVVRAGPWLHSVDIDPRSPTFGHVVHEAWLWPAEGITVDDFDLNPADGLLYGVATHEHGHGVVVSIDPRTGRTRTVPGVGRLPGGSGYGAVTLAPDGALYATNNNRGGRSTLWRVALDGSGVVTEISSRKALHTIDSSGCLSTIPIPTTTTTPPTTTTTTPPTTTTTTTTTTPPTTTTTTTTTTAPPTTRTTTPIPTTTTTTTTPPPRTTTTIPRTTTTTTTTTTVRPAPAVPPNIPPPLRTTPPRNTPPPEPPPPPVPPPPPADIEVPDRRVVTLEPTNNTVRDQRRWGLVAIILILAAGALARQAASRRR
ncbi:hypothetical protein ADK67_17655 [Saccharothrix sp. NRRL B-16348]|uniref:hypothetical protein n=1 Tax=Saccharothrix sp. NRRL B-16348 TaxID=1415542 RepID=UPI0006AFA779|nr:hypothetical protein [Saccharothrix sp. NRRL B-16348]KOX24790.1 hypothetical protein ADK67_17655 [Saccharothrix sp. NRRL B-16348]